ncbi:MAG: glycosyltransferase family 2 protein [Lentisphaeria bacterium]|nr:glycosyltransferase family 2 protein [Lentisphaeria bacterium]
MNLETEKIEILLATYQSEAFLCEQLDSILHQSDQNWSLLIHDGGSTDGTVEIIRSYEKKYPGKIRLTGSSRASACMNFSQLMGMASAELIMLSDHDDVWLPDKIAETRKKFVEEMKKLPAGTPLLVFSDSRIVDQNLNMIFPSLMHYSNLDPGRLALSQLLVQNVPHGNTMMFNSALCKLAYPIPRKAVMHDNWISLTAAAFGKIAFLNQTTLLYRQHDCNVFGASCYSVPSLIKKIYDGKQKLLFRWYMNVSQAQAFLEANRNRLQPDQLRMLELFANIKHAGFFQKRYILFHYKIWKTGIMRNIGMLLLI